jgi:FixJ family two-component response regulator
MRIPPEHNGPTPNEALASIAIQEAGMPTKPVISIVDDDESVRDGTADLIESMGFIARTFPHAEGFLQSDSIRCTACLITDVRMPGMTGLELHERLAAAGNVIPTILVTAFPNDRDRAQAMSAGVMCYLSKPFSEDDLLACIDVALKHDETDDKNA